MKQINILRFAFQIFLIGMFAIIGKSTLANTSYVVNTNDAGAGSLRDEISTANTGDTIIIDVSGTITANSSITIDKDLVIIGPAPIHLTYVGPSISNAIVIDGATVELEGVAFKNMSGSQEVFQINNSGKLTISDCLFDANTVGSIRVGNGGDISVNRCSFFDISTFDRAGIIFVPSVGDPATGIIQNCTFFNCQGNSGVPGDAIYVQNSNVNITNNTFFDNRDENDDPSSLNVGTGGVVNLRNNLFFDSNGDNPFNISVNTGTINTNGGNYGNQSNAPGLGLNDPSDDFLSTNDPQLSTSYTTDGWGLKYFTFADNSSGAIDIDQNSTGLETFDQRRVWRIMNGGSGDFADAGAVEYSQLTVSQAGVLTAGTLQDLVDYNLSSTPGNLAIVFEITGTGPFNCDTDFGPFNIPDDVIINGYSQNGSRVPGPGSNQVTVSPGYTPILVTKGFGNNNQGAFNLDGQNIVLAGLSIGGYTGFMNYGVTVNGFNANINGCNIGVDANGNTSLTNDRGIVVSELASAKIGSGNYCGHNYHNNRNVVAGNGNAQIVCTGGESIEISRNFIGLGSDGYAPPTSAPSTPDSGIVFMEYLSINNPNIIGGNHLEDYNLIGGMEVGIFLGTGDNKIYNNVVGGNLAADDADAGTTNTYGIMVSGNTAFNNYIGDQNKGNVIIGNTTGIQILNGANNNFILGNNIGVSIYGDVAVGNSSNGVEISGSTTINNQIGSSTAGNTISNNSYGVRINNAPQNKIYNNYIGVSGDGSGNMGNSTYGVGIGGTSAVDNEIGGPNLGNVIAYNQDGIGLVFNSVHTTVQGNYIGLESDGNSAGANANHGIHFTTSAEYNMIGGCDVNERNYICNNVQDGISIQGMGADNDTIYGNFIGINVGGNAAGNGNYGISVYDGAGFITIGDTAGNCGNKIANNFVGVAVGGGAPSNEVSISGNSIHNNNDIGIDVDSDGANLFWGDGAPSSNGGAEISFLDYASNCGGNTKLAFEPDNALDVQIEVFQSNDSQEGEIFIGRYEVLSPVSGISNEIDLGTVIPVGTELVVTYTYRSAGLYKNTSEFSNVVTVTGPPAAVTVGISSPDACEFDTPVSIGSSGYTGDVVWFNDPGLALANRIGLGDTIQVPGNDMNSIGTYQYYAVDSVAGCYGNVSIALTLTVHPIPSFTMVDVCVGESAAQIPSVPGGTWASMGGDAVATIDGATGVATGVSSGSTTFFYTSPAGCDNESTSITVNPLPDATGENHLINNVLCNGGASGSIGYMTTFVTPPVTHSWVGPGHSGTNSNSLLGLVAGSYTNTYTDGNGCSNTDVITITEPSSIMLTVVEDNGVTCNGDADGQVSASASGGSAPYVFEWFSDAGYTISIGTGSTYTGSAGIYYVRVTDGNACTEDGSVVISEPAPIVVNESVNSNYNGEDISCNGFSDGSVTCVPTGGTIASDYTYSWDSGQNTQTANGLAAGTYSITVIDDNGCDNFGTVTLTEPTAMVISSGGDQLICDGSSTSISAIATGGTGVITYSWSPGVGLDNSSIQSPTTNPSVTTTYTVTASDDNGCNINDAVDVIVNPNPTQVVTSNDISCNGLSDGSISIAPSNGSVPYQYSIDGGFSYATLNPITGLSSGTYNVITRDANGCQSGTFVAIINEPTVITANESVTSNYNGADISCAGSSDGAVTCVPSGGTVSVDYNYNWTLGGTPIGTTASITGLAAGSYNLTVSDDNGCSNSVSVTLTSPSAITVNAGTDASFCSGGSSNLIGIGSGGTGALGYSWNNPGDLSNSSISNPVATPSVTTTFTLTVTDDNSCTNTDDVVVTVNANPTQVVSVTDISCNGLSDGTITIVPGSAQAPYDHSIDGGLTFSATASYSGLSAGTYNIITQDANGCQSTTNVSNINEPNAIVINESITSNYNGSDISCFGLSDGAVTCAPTGGTAVGDYGYSWSSGAASQAATGLSSGTYSITVTDDNGCNNTGSLTLTEPTQLNVTTSPDQGVCDGASLLVSASASGGVGAYDYSWTPNTGIVNPNSNNPSLLISGTTTYTVVVSDDNGCVANDNLTITAYPLPSFTATVTDVTCNGASDGIISLTPSGGTAPYQYSTDLGVTYAVTNPITGLSSGNYDILIQDGNGCSTAAVNVNINEPAPVTFVSSIAEDTCGNEVGQISFTPAGGNAPYQFSTDNGLFFGNSSIIGGLASGNYDLIVQDNNGCQSSVSNVDINLLSGIQISLGANSPQVSCFGDSDGSISVNVDADPFGSLSYNWELNGGFYSSSTSGLTGLTPGNYQLVVTDAANCRDTINHIITEPMLLSATYNIADASCSGSADGQIDTVSVSGGTPGYNYQWFELISNTLVGTNANVSGLSSADYISVITDVNGCTYRDTMTVSNGESYIPNIVSAISDSCINSNNVDFADDNGGPISGAQSHNWEFNNATLSNSSLSNPTGLEFNTVGSNLIVYNVTSNAGCVFVDSMYVNILNIPQADAGVDQSICLGQSATINMTPSGNFSYLWELGGVGTTVANTQSTQVSPTVSSYYVAILTDAITGCVGKDSVSVAVNNGPNANAGADQTICNGDLLTMSVTPSSSDYSYSWEIGGGSGTIVGTDASINFVPSSSNYYVVTVTETATGCIGKDSLTVLLNTINQPSIDQLGPIPFCVDANFLDSLSVTSNAIGSLADFTWSSSNLLNTIGNGVKLYLNNTNTTSDWYYVVENLNGCSSLPDSIYIDATISDLIPDNSDLDYCPGEDFVLNASGSGIIDWQEDGNAIGNTVAVFPQGDTATYYVSMSLDGCVFNDSLQLTIDPSCDNTVITTNAFSPDGDGVNDQFILDIPSLLVNNNTFKVFNRWGDLIKTIENYNNTSVAWNGTNESDQPVVSGTYYFIIEIPDAGVKQAGWVQIVR